MSKKKHKKRGAKHEFGKNNLIYIGPGVKKKNLSGKRWGQKEKKKKKGVFEWS